MADAMCIHIITPALPPMLDGIGDHSSRLAEAMKNVGVNVTLLAPYDSQVDAVPELRVAPVFSPKQRQSVWALTDAVAADKPDWVVLEYNPFSYGRWGLNLSLPRAFAAIQRQSPSTRLAIFAHEQFTPLSGAKQSMMSIWQRWQFWRLGRAADVIFASMHSRLADNYRRFPGVRVIHVPVGSNIPRVAIERADARFRLGIGHEDAVVGIFGTAHHGRLLEPVRDAMDAVAAAGLRPLVLYIGPDGAVVREAMEGHRVIADGPLSPDEVSRRLSAVDVYFGGFADGVSTRRGSWLAALGHGLACVGTSGVNTDPVFRTAAADGTIILVDAADPQAFRQPLLELLSDSSRRERLASAAIKFSDREFAWDRLAAKVLDAFL